MTETWSETYKSLPIGAEESSSQQIDGAAINAFANAIQGFNPIHMDGAWVRANTPYPDRIAHGVMNTALMSKPLFQFCERWKIRAPRVLTSSKYIRPVIAGYMITSVVRLVEKINPRRRVRFEVEAKNQRGEVVMVGEMVEQAL